MDRNESGERYWTGVASDHGHGAIPALEGGVVVASEYTRAESDGIAEGITLETVECGNAFLRWLGY